MTQRLVDLIEYGFGCRENIGKRFAHADLLTALTRKDECASHEFLRDPAVESAARWPFVLVVAALVHSLPARVKAGTSEFLAGGSVTSASVATLAFPTAERGLTHPQRRAGLRPRHRADRAIRPNLDQRASDTGACCLAEIDRRRVERD